MKIGLIPINIQMESLEKLVGLAQFVESQGFESVWTFEHVMVPVEYESRYPYNKEGKMGGGSDNPFLDPLIALTAVAAHTKTLRLGTGVNILSQANPLLLAKQAASLDVLSGGRFMLGAGIGWLKEEFDAMGVPFERRGARDHVSWHLGGAHDKRLRRGCGRAARERRRERGVCKIGCEVHLATAPLKRLDAVRFELVCDEHVHGRFSLARGSLRRDCSYSLAILNQVPTSSAHRVRHITT